MIADYGHVAFRHNTLKLLVTTKGYGVRAIEGQNAFAPSLFFA